MKSGIKHVYWAANTRTWFVEIRYKGKKYRSMNHETVEEAAAALAELKKEIGLPIARQPLKSLPSYQSFKDQ